MLNPRRPYWTVEEDRRLRILWQAGWSTAAIGLTIGRGKNAVCGRARRINLPERESPIPVKKCPFKTARFQREVDAAHEAAREELMRTA